MENKSGWVFGAIMSLIVLVIFFLIGLSIGIGSQGGLTFTSDTLSSWVAALATVCIAILTIFLAKETWHLRHAQILQINELRKESIRPNLEFYLLPAPASFQFMNVHIENNGKGVARNIKFSFSGENDAPFTDNEQLVVEKFTSLNILRNGMLALGHGKQRTSFIFSFIDFSDKMGDDTFNIKINVAMSYEDSEQREYQSESMIDFSEFKGIREIGGGDPTYNLYQETKKIREIFQSAQGGMSSKRINVNSSSSKDRTEEQNAIMARIEEQRSNNS